jgi:hypothetical protein
MPTLTPAAGVRLPHSVIRWLVCYIPRIKLHPRKQLTDQRCHQWQLRESQEPESSQRSMAVSIDNLHCRCEVFWSVLESSPLMGWLTISSCWVVRQHLAWFSVPLGLQVLHLRVSPLGSHSQWDRHGISLCIYLSGFPFLSASSKYPVSLLALTSPHVLFTAVASQEINLLLWNLQFSVLLSLHALSVPSALSSSPYPLTHRSSNPRRILDTHTGFVDKIDVRPFSCSL